MIQPEIAINDALLQTRDLNTLTAKERTRIMKEQKARDEFEKMKTAAEEAYLRNKEAKQRMYNQFHSSFTN